MKKKRAADAGPEPLEAVLERAGEDRFAPHRQPVPGRVWRAAVGARIADRTVPIALERRVLVVKAATSVWANELSLLSDTILERLRASGIDVIELRFRVGPVDPPARPPERRVSRAVPAPAPLPKDLADELRAVADKELRETIALAARANLAWQDHVSEPRTPRGPAPARINEAPRDARAPRSSGTKSDPPGRS